MATQNLYINCIGFIRIMLMLKDAKKYFENCYNGFWNGLTSESRKIYEKLAPDVLDIIKSNGIQIDH